MQNDINNIYLKISARVLEINFDKLFIVQLSDLMPFLNRMLINIFLLQLRIVRLVSPKIPWMKHFMEELTPFGIINWAQEIVDYRKMRSTKQKRTDLLQLMIDANAVNENENEREHANTR